MCVCFSVFVLGPFLERVCMFLGCARHHVACAGFLEQEIVSRNHMACLKTVHAGCSHIGYVFCQSNVSADVVVFHQAKVGTLFASAPTLEDPAEMRDWILQNITPARGR